jgi:hypothetical protein
MAPHRLGENVEHPILDLEGAPVKGAIRRVQTDVVVHFGGKRGARRVHRDLDIVVRGKGRSRAFDAETVDISRNGALFEICDTSFEGLTDFQEYVLVVQREFGKGIEFSVPAQGINVLGRIIRVVRTVEGRRIVDRVACTFDEALSHANGRALGIVEGDGR